MHFPCRLPVLALSAAVLWGASSLPPAALARGGGAYRFRAPEPAAAPIERQAPAPQTSSVERAVPQKRPAPATEPEDRRSWTDQVADRDLHEGYRGSHPLYGPGSRSPWTGHNISQAQFQRFNRNGWNYNGNNRWNDGRNQPWNNPANNFYNRNVGGWNNIWANGGYWGSRPWGYGWYSWNPGTWSWWGSASPGWGLTALAGAAVITDLVNDATSQQSTVIDVPDSDYELNYATVDSVGSSGADFSYAVADSPPVKGAANCQEGLLDGQVPSTPAQAQLLNAACQVAYGPDPKGTPLPEALAGELPGWLRDLLVLALGGGLATAGWQMLARRRGTRAAALESTMRR